MVFGFLYNAIYATNPFGHEYRKEEVKNMPSLPTTIRDFYDDHTPFAAPKKKLDARFPQKMRARENKCYYNYAVWRQCLLEHSGPSFDESDENAKICKKYKGLAIRTCPGDYMKKFNEQVEKDNFIGMIGLNQRVLGKNPTTLFVDDEGYINRIVNQSENSHHKYKVGEKFRNCSLSNFYVEDEKE